MRRGAPILLVLLLAVLPGCTGDDDPKISDGSVGGKKDGKATAADRGLFPDGYRLYSCKTPGQSCNAHDPCAINPICGMDQLCRPQGLMDCKDDLACTVDTCAGLGICENKPKAGFCKLPVRVGGPPDLGAGDGGAADAGVLPDYGAAKTVFRCFKKGERNPNDQCQVCEPGGDDTGVKGDPTHWTAANGGSCDDGDPCTVNDYCQAGTCKGTSYRAKCATGYACVTAACDGKGGCLAPTLKTGWCLINGACYQEKAAHPTGACLTCDPSVNPAVWTPITNTCNIGGKCYAKGAPNPAGCGECDPSKSTSAWTVSGTTCCLIGGTAYKAGTKDSTGCSSCAPQKSTTSWTPLTGLCLISGKCYQKGDKHTGGCAECVPATSATSWTVTGSYCLVSNTCYNPGDKDQSGCASCVPSKNKYAMTPNSGQCKIGAACVNDGAKHPEGCAECKASQNPYGWTLTASGYCLIDASCYKDGTTQGCFKCDTASSTTSWTKPAGCTFLDLDVGKHSSTYSASQTRGFWFTAPTNFTIVGLRVPTDVGTEVQNIHVMKFTAIPPNYSSTTNNFTTLYYGKGIAGTSHVSVNLPIKKGEIIGILGARGTSTMKNSYGSGNTYNSTILNLSVALKRLIYQGNLYSAKGSNLSTESGGSYTRIEVRYTP